MDNALVLLLASEFQGFCRDLHNDAVEAIACRVAGPKGRLRKVISLGLTVNRGLDKRGADVETLNGDFLRLGTALARRLIEKYPDVAPVWLEGLRCLHKARNGVIHDDSSSLAVAQEAGWTLEIATVRRWRKLVDEVASAMGYIVSTDIAELVGNYSSQSGGSR